MNYKKEADKIVEMFIPFTDNCSTGYEKARLNAIQCAIEYVKGKLEVIQKIGNDLLYKELHNPFIAEQEEKYSSILNQLKQM